MYTQLSNNVGNKIKDLRLAAGLSQKQVAEYLSVDQSQISKIENGERDLSVSMIKNLSDLFCCPVAAIVYDDAENPSVGVAFRSGKSTVEDLKALAKFNRIVLNQMEMVDLLERVKDNDR